MNIFSSLLLGLLCLSCTSLARIHQIGIESDHREMIPLIDFGLTKKGFIDINLSVLQINDNQDATYGLVIECSRTMLASQYTLNHINVCRPESIAFYDKHPKLINMELKRDAESTDSHFDPSDMHDYGAENWDISTLIFSDFLNEGKESTDGEILASYSPANKTYSAHFQMQTGPKNEGQYTVYFYRCPKEATTFRTSVNYKFKATIVARNGYSYLSAGEKCYPFLYTAVGLVYFVLAWVWLRVMLHHSDNLFKIHYLMGALVFAKFLACILHAVDYYFIGSRGTPDEAWAVLWYIIHLVRGLLLFISLALIGMGFAFVKHVLSSNEKLVLMTVVPLQILANVAYIIIDSSEEADLNYGTWKKILIFVDLLCCGAIIFPVMWSISHLQKATERSDNKTSLILSQLKLFRHFYTLVVVYIYITRIALQVLEVVLPFQYTWLSGFLDEITTIALFLVTGWKFRPYVSNPYYKIVNEDEDELEMEHVMVESDTLRNRTFAEQSDEGSA